MGLDTTHNCYHGAYSWFNSFREWIFRNIWLNPNDFIWYSRDWEWTKDLKDIWHPILPLLNHSDCDGILDKEDQESIIIWWNQILANLIEKNELYENKLKQFIEWCELALEDNEDVEFW